MSSVGRENGGALLAGSPAGGEEEGEAEAEAGAEVEAEVEVERSERPKQREGEEGERDEEAEVEDDGGSSFPLYTRALEYICHGDFHVRIAALTVVLNIYNQRDPLVRAYLNGPAAQSASLPDRLVGALRSQCLVLADRAMAAGVGGGGGSDGRGGRGGGGGGGPGGAGAGGAAAIDPTICRDSIAGLQDQVCVFFFFNYDRPCFWVDD